jgi:peptide/nickel transport system ATP-binding protein|nr:MULTISPECIES: ABC transporter ATP-binding protein [Chelativorans]
MGFKTYSTRSNDVANIIEIKSLSVDFRSVEGTIHAVRDVSLHIGAGERVAVVGESGSGKSVTARAILGLLPHRTARSSGSILFENTEILNSHRSDRLRGRDITMIFQDPTAALNPMFRVREQFAAVLARGAADPAKGDPSERMNEALRQVSITDPERVLDSYAFELSGGLNQRVMIAMALANHPRLILADEPGTALDVTVQNQTLKIMRDLTERQNSSVLLISHNLGVVRSFADRIYIMYAGSIVEEGRTADVFRSPQHPYTQALINAVPRLSARIGPKGIPGSVPSARSDINGCAFAPRCKFSRPNCMNGTIGLRGAGQHRAACVLLDEVAAP